MSALDVLRCPMQQNDAGAATVRDYLKALLRTLWQEEEEFSGKRPFGNGGWQSEVYTALVREGLIDGEWSEFEETEYDEVAGYAMVLQAIGELL